MIGGNPISDTIPDAAQLDALRASLSQLIASVAPMFSSSGSVGGFSVLPTVSPNQGGAEAFYSHFYNGPGFTRLSSSIKAYQSSQVMADIGKIMWETGLASRLGATGRDDAVASMELAGRSPGVAGLVSTVADSILGGVMGGSFNDSAALAFAGRRQLMGGRMSDADYVSSLNPYSTVSGSRSLAATSMYLGLVNARINPNGIVPDLSFTRGLDRRTIAQAGLAMAQAGAFNDASGASLAGVLGDIDTDKFISDTTYSSRAKKDAYGNVVGYDGVDISWGDDYDIDPDTADSIRAAGKRVQDGLEAGIDALSALRDLTGDSENLVERLDQLTQGDWKRSSASAKAATSDLRKIQATAQMYNINPQEAASRLDTSRGLLMAAAGFTKAEQLMGWSGGGMFSLHAQAETMAATEDAIAARGIDANSPLANRFRMQQAQATARSMNTRAGVGVQILASLYQNGSLDSEARDELASQLTSGSDSSRSDALNRVLTMWAGSADRGRTLMQDSAVINSLRQGLSSESGAWALSHMATGARNEWAERERNASVGSRLDMAVGMLQRIGGSATLDDDSASGVVDSIANAMSGSGIDGGDVFAGMMRDQYARLRKQGYSGQAALDAAISTVTGTEAGAKFSSVITEAGDAARLSAYRSKLNLIGPDAAGAMAQIQAMLQLDDGVGGKAISYEDADRLQRAISSGTEAERDAAYDELDGLTRGLSGAQKDYVEYQRNFAYSRFVDENVRLTASQSASDLLASSKDGVAYGSYQAEQALGAAIGALREFSEGSLTVDEYKARIGESRLGDMFDGGADDFLQVVSGLDGSAIMSDGLKAAVGGVLKSKGALHSELQVQAVKLNSAMGFDNSQLGYYGGTFGRAQADVERTRNDIIGKLDELGGSQDVANARKSFMQDLVSFVTGDGTLGDLLRVGRSDNKASILRRSFGGAFAELYERNQSAVQAKSQAMSAVTEMLGESGGLGDDAKAAVKTAVSKIQELSLSDGATPESLTASAEDIISRNNLTGDAADKVRAFATAHIDALSSSDEMSTAVADLAGSSDIGQKMANFNKAREAEAAVRAFHLDAFSRIDTFGIKAGTALGNKIDEAVSDDEVGIDGSGTDDERLAVKIAYLKKQAASGELDYSTSAMADIEKSLRAEIPSSAGAGSDGSMSAVVERLDAIKELMEGMSVGAEHGGSANGSSPALSDDSTAAPWHGGSSPVRLTGTITIIDGSESVSARADFVPKYA